MGKRTKGATGPSLRTWAKQKINAVTKMAGVAPNRRVNAPWMSPRKSSSSTNGAPTTSRSAVTTQPAMPSGVEPSMSRPAVLGVLNPLVATTIKMRISVDGTRPKRPPVTPAVRSCHRGHDSP